MYTFSITSTHDIEHAVIQDLNLTRRQVADRMMAMRAMTRGDKKTYIITISHESEEGGGNYVWSYLICDGVDDKTLMPPTYYGFWRKKYLV